MIPDRDPFKQLAESLRQEAQTLLLAAFRDTHVHEIVRAKEDAARRIEALLEERRGSWRPPLVSAVEAPDP
jgi:hypothetical protein